MEGGDGIATVKPVAADFLKDVESRIAGWIKDEAATKQRLRDTALCEGWTAQLLAEHLRQATLTPDTLAKALGLSEHMLRERLSKAGGLFTVGDMILHARLQRAAELLAERLASTAIIDIAQACGWDDPRRFAVCFKALWGVSPKEFQAKRQSSINGTGK